MKMRKKIGIIATVVGVIDLFVWIVLLFTGNALTFGGFTPVAMVVFILWFVCVIVAIPCLVGEVAKFLGKSFSAGFNSSSNIENANRVYCTNCGKPIDASVAFCPHCGTKKM